MIWGTKQIKLSQESKGKSAVSTLDQSQISEGHQAEIKELEALIKN